ncbi:alpha/beta hydrolase [Aquimarina sp. 2201CG5-10]|uniref:alpha/beta hydrolase n=1 Tax=Aquimarina callyspongiae TaxID=3098150 RepID=UPI002AB4EE75|nr:dienelactone hydrolase family protein [Aquimarina sp. 2201CG5-10]MDY8134051.1 dienelactone hydrolase family protein [Aquimarina sp. 2201CG5-10]
MNANIYANESLLVLDIFESMYHDQYDLYIPNKVDNKKPPLYIILPGGVDEKYISFRDSLIVPGLKDHQGIIFSPKISWKKPDEKLLENIITDFISTAIKAYSIDQNKITLIGYSNGAIQATKLAEQKGYLFSTVVLMVSNFNITKKIETPIFIIHGTTDRYFSLKKANKAYTLAKKIGCNVTFLKAEGKNDTPPSQYKNELRELTRWLENNIW